MIDDLDEKILQILSLNSRATVKKIAEITNSSPSTISRKIKRLEESGAIRGYVSILGDGVLGIECRGILLVKFSGKTDVENVLGIIERMPEVCNLFHTLGNYDLVIIASVKDNYQLHGIIEKIRTLEGIAWIDTASIISRRKVLNKTIIE